MHGAAILTIGVIIMKLLGFIYKIPLGNILGDEGYSMFLSAYNIYNVFFALATAGLPVALSRLVAEADRAVPRPSGGKDLPRCAQDVFRHRPCVRADTVPAARLARRDLP
ncbi:MAG: oligosaccharide flippase family protein [Oscillospiraceae bacterium]